MILAAEVGVGGRLVLGVASLEVWLGDGMWLGFVEADDGMSAGLSVKALAL